MSRSAKQLQQQQQQLLLQQQQQMAENEAAALAAEMFNLFCVATTMRQILGLYRNMCDTIGLRAAPLNEFYPKLKAKIRSWKAQALWKKFDARASHRVYNKGNACTGTRVLVIGAGPCGLRTAIEAQLLGAKVVVIEKRDRISRNNVLHLWPFVITDLRNLGAKKFYGKFCAGSIDHISIRQLQCILLKVALLLGVEIHEGVSFENTIEPSEGCGWRAEVIPEDHAVSHYEFDVLIGADGKRNTLEGFKRKEFRGKLAIAITANFINKKTEAEAKAEEISGIAFIFNQSFFKELYSTTGIDLENIVYYKDDTHYFVMTAKKHSLIDKGVIMQDFADPAELLAPANVNTEKLLDYAREAAEFSTKYEMPNLEFAVNHYGKPDVAMFDFTSMFAAETSCRVLVRKNYRLLQCLVGDSLLEPFWPTGSGCARGFLSSMDAAYTIKLWNNSRNSILGVIAQRESIYRLLAQTTPENLQRDTGAYTVDPATRYPNLNRFSVKASDVQHLVDTDNKTILEQTDMDANALQITAPETPVRRKRRTGDSLPLGAVLLRWVKAQLHSYEFTQELTEVSDCFTNGKVLCALINRYRPDLVDLNSIKDCTPIECNERAFKILEKDLRIPRVMSAKDSIRLDNVDSKIWLTYLEQICEEFRGEIPHVKHPKLDVAELREKTNAAPDFSKLLQRKANKAKSPLQDMDVPNVMQRRSVLDEEKVKRQRKYGAEGGHLAQNDTPRRAKKRRSAEKSANIDRERGIASAMPRGTDEHFSDRIKNMEQRITSRNASGLDKKPKDLMRAIGKIDSTDWNVREIEKKIQESKKTETGHGRGREKVPKWSKEQFLARQNKMAKPDKPEEPEEKFKEIDQTLKNLDKQLKEGRILEVGERGRNKVASIAGHFVKKDDTSEEKNPPSVQKSNSKVAIALKKQSASEKCHFCRQTVYLMEKINTEGLILHRSCLKCHHCHTNLRLGGYAFDRDDPIGRFYCTQHFRLPAKPTRPVVRKSGHKRPANADQKKPVPDDVKTPEKPRGRAESVAQLELLDRGQTPERIEFENADAMSDGEPSLENIIDENEWTDRNFVSDSEESESDLSSSDNSDDESDSDMFEEANGSPIGAQTLQLATDWIGKQRYSNVNSDDSDDDFYDSSEDLLDDDKDDSQTEGEEFKKAREMRREEVRLLPIPTNIPTDTETEVQSDDDSSSPDEVELNSATEISTDSEFDQDPVIRETPKIFIDDTHLRKPTKVQIKQTVIGTNSGQNRTQQTSSNHHNNNNDNKTAGFGFNSMQTAFKKQQQQRQEQQQQKQREVEFKPLVQVDPSLLSQNRMPLKNPRPGDYLLNKTASTEGIASKKSLELKKRYLLGGEQANGNKIMKSGSTSVLDSKLKSFHSNISECQKLLNPSSDISSSMKTFLDRSRYSADSSGLSSGGGISGDIKVEKSEEKENVFVASKNELNKGVETVNTALVESLTKPIEIIETVDLTSPEKKQPPSNKLDINRDEIIDLTQESPVKSDKTIVEEIVDKPDISKDVKEIIPDILTQVDDVKIEKRSDEEKKDSPEKVEAMNKETDLQVTSIQVPNIPWGNKKNKIDSDSMTSSSTSASSSSVEDIQHYILDSTTSPETQTGGSSGIVPRLEVHDSSGTLMQIDSLMIIDGKYIGDPEDLKHMEIPEGLKLPGQDEEEEKQESEKSQPPTPTKPELKFDAKNANKIDSLRNLPLIVDQSETQSKKVIKPSTLELKQSPKELKFVDKDKTPTAELWADNTGKNSDSETEMTGQILTETELSDWTADDAISENFVDMEFVLNSNKGTIKRNKKKSKNSKRATPVTPKAIENSTRSSTDKECGILKNLAIDEIEFMDTGSEGSCAEALNAAMMQNRGYVEFVDNHAANARREYMPPMQKITYIDPPATRKARQEIAGIDYIEQGACILQNSCEYDLKTPVNETTPAPVIEKAVDSAHENDENTTTNTATTTEESEALTIVTSPLDSSSPKTQENFNLTTSTNPSSSDTGTHKTPTRKSSQDEISLSHSKRAPTATTDEMSYEEYVRKLQHKIAQISGARDSLDVRKHRRKSSKGDLISDHVVESNSSVIEPIVATTQTPAVVAVAESHTDRQKVPEIPTLSRKLEEITKERTKQKDLIHDLVMDKLQSKKQLNAEKRLNRSRNRSLFASGAGSGSSLSPTPRIAPPNTDCTNAPHYHMPSSVMETKSIVRSPKSPKDNKDIVRAFAAVSTNKPRPFSENLDPDLVQEKLFKLAKTQSFNYAKTPLGISKLSNDTPLTTNTEKLRLEARARARAKSNQELGLSPEEKLQLLRKRYHLELQDIVSAAAANGKTDSADLRARARKMVSSKSVSDIVAAQKNSKSIENFKAKTSAGDLFVASDSNLPENKKPAVLKPQNRRNKDPERRKSIIQTVSSFFNKAKKEKDSPSPTKDKAASGGLLVGSGVTDGMFNRFRISSRSKEKSKDKEELPSSSMPSAHDKHHERSISQEYIRNKYDKPSYASSPQLFKNSTDEQTPPPIPPLPLNYQRSDDESYATETRDQKKQRAISKACRQAELKRLRIAQEIQREQEEIEVQLKELEARGVLIEKTIRGEVEDGTEYLDPHLACDEKLLLELFDIWGSITQLKKRDEELGIRQQELQLEHRHAQLKDELNLRLSCSKLNKSSSDVAAEGAILNEMLEIVAKRAALRPSMAGTSSSIDDPIPPPPPLVASSSTVNRQSTENESDVSTLNYGCSLRLSYVGAVAFACIAVYRLFLADQ